MIRKDKDATTMMGFTDPRSFVGYRIHPETHHACIYLFGDDVTQIRRVIFDREQGICWRCRAYYGWEQGELRHLVGGLGLQRCWCHENLGWGCPACHKTEHVQVRSDKRRPAAA